MREHFPSDRLAVSWRFTSDPVKAEKELLAAYLAEFGERPPLNQQG
jgi:hypothetical protein